MRLFRVYKQKLILNDYGLFGDSKKGTYNRHFMGGLFYKYCKNKRLNSHTARKTFASTVLLYNDVPMEIVSELLGHSSISITEDSYGKVVKRKVSEQMMRLNKNSKIFFY